MEGGGQDSLDKVRYNQYMSAALKELQRRIQAMEMRCYRKILRSSYKDHVTNEEVRAKIQQAIELPDHRKEAQTEMVWTYLLFIRSGQNHLARHTDRGKKTRQTEEEVGRQHQGMDRPGVRQVPASWHLTDKDKLVKLFSVVLYVARKKMITSKFCTFCPVLSY